MGALVGVIGRLLTLAGKLAFSIVGLARKIVFWLTVGIFVWLRGRRRKKGEARRLVQAVEAGRQQGLSEAQPPPAEEPPSSSAA